MTVSVMAAALIGAGCSSVRSDPAPAYGGVAPPPAYSSSGTYDSVEFGTVRGIEQLQTAHRNSGAGALLGAVVGGVVGNQIGAGTGRAAATALGAVGGAVVGNHVEDRRNDNTQVYYQIDVRLDNNDNRSFDYQDLNGLRVGDRVRIRDGQLQRW